MWQLARGRSWRAAIVACALTLVLAACAGPVISTPPATPTIPARQDFPTVDPDYIYSQLAYMATHFLHREAGYDTNLSPSQNGHDEFAAYWAQEISSDLQGFGPTVYHDTFSTAGWLNRPPPTSAFNVEVTVPGVQHPEQEVIIGCHYDGEAVSTQSANDDASGCAIELGVAKALATYWKAHQLYPARTLRFVLFDAEEQGLYGSFHYVNDTINGDLSNVVAMINEEQNGIAYPLRYLGTASNPLLPFFMDLTPLQSNRTYPALSQLTAQQHQQIAAFRALVGQAVAPAFAQFRAIGSGTVSYANDNGQAEPQAVFTPGQQNNIIQEDDIVGASDEMPFTFAGLPCVTYIGNFTYYPEFGGSHPPPWSYPFDQPDDTIQLMNVYANGTTSAAESLKLALALPGMLTAWLLNQPAVLGSASAPSGPIAAISDIGQTIPGTPLAVNASAAYTVGGGALTYTWDFGDGTKATGVAATHTYANPGSYTLTLRVKGAGGTTTVTKQITVATTAPNFPNPYASELSDGIPPRNPAIVIPTPVP